MSEHFYGEKRVHDQLRSRIQQVLHPSFAVVGTKVLFIHGISSLVSLAICPQFGFRLFVEGDGLMHYFMMAGPEMCQALCGGFYFSSTIVTSGLFLTRYEWAAVRQHPLRFLPLLIGLSLGVFWMLAPGETFNLISYWLVGSLLFSYLGTRFFPRQLKFVQTN